MQTPFWRFGADLGRYVGNDVAGVEGSGDVYRGGCDAFDVAVCADDVVSIAVGC